MVEIQLRTINFLAISLARYIARILKRTKDELKVMDRKIRKITTSNRMYIESLSDTDRLCIPILTRMTNCIPYNCTLSRN